MNEPIHYALSPDEFPPSPNSWTRKCINMFEFFTQDSQYADAGIEFTSSQLYIANNAVDLWIDEVSIQQQQNQSMDLYTLMQY